MELQLSPRSNRPISFGPPPPVLHHETAPDSPTLLAKRKSVRFTTGDIAGSLENRLVSALEQIATSSRRQTELLDHISKLSEDQLTLQHQQRRDARIASSHSARVYNSQMVQQANAHATEFESAPLAVMCNAKGALPSQINLSAIDSTSAFSRLSLTTLPAYLQFYGLTEPTVYLNPTADRKAGAMRLVLGKHLGLFGLHGLGTNLTEFGASES